MRWSLIREHRLLFAAFGVLTLSVVFVAYRALSPTNESHCWETFSFPDFSPTSQSETVEPYLADIVGLPSGDAWAVGYKVIWPAPPLPQTGAQQAITMRFDHGQKVWDPVTTPQITQANSVLNGVSAVSLNDIWAVGFFGPQLADLAVSNGIDSYLNQPMYVPGPSGSRTLAMHWNGSKWYVVRTPDPGTDKNGLTNVFAVSSDDVWAAGWSGYANSAPVRPLLMHWDGKAWTERPTPKYKGGDLVIAGMRATSTGDVWAVGQTSDATVRLHILHWDESTGKWTDIPEATGGGIFSGEEIASESGLRQAAILTSSDAWSIGKAAFMDGSAVLAAHWDGNRWTAVPAPNWGATAGVGKHVPPWGNLGSYLSAVSAAGSDDIWAVGTWGDAGFHGVYSPEVIYNRPFALHWDGKNWNAELDPMPFDNDMAGLQAVSATKDTVWALGAYSRPDNDNPSRAVPVSFLRETARCQGVPSIQPVPTETPLPTSSGPAPVPMDTETPEPGPIYPPIPSPVPSSAPSPSDQP